MSIWTVTSAAAYRADMRADLDLEAGTALQYRGSLAGAYTTAAAELAFRVDTAVSEALGTILLASAPEPVVVALALQAGLNPRRATFSRYIVQIAGAGELPQGTLLQGGGPSGRSRWEVVDETATVNNGADVTIQAVVSGPTETFTGDTDLTLVTPVTGITGASYDASGGDPFQIGEAAETVGELRVRVEQARSRGGTYPSIAAELRNISWVTAVDVREGAGGAGTIAVTLVPAPVGADQEAELAAALYSSKPAGSTLEGAESLTTPGVNGTDVTVSYAVGAQEAVAVVANIIGDGTLSDADLEDTVVAAINAYFDTLGPGDVARYTRVLAAVFTIPSVIGSGVFTLDGGGVDVTPTLAANQLVPTPITVTVA